MIDLHFDRTPNCWKIAIMLEEVSAAYNVVKYDLLAGDHLSVSYHTINPNHKLPAMVDHDPDDGGEPIVLAETAAMLIYLAEKHGRLLPRQSRHRAPVLQWLAWQVSGLGPMMGQASHFLRYARSKDAYSITRYSSESRRLMAVLDGLLAGRRYVAGEYSIADIAIWPWAHFVEQVGIGVELAAFPNVQRWGELIEGRSAVARVFTNPETAVDPGYLQKTRTLTDTEWSNLYGDRMHAASTGVIS
jgi:GSH-dependent disulfide-bond oxidoreductase